MGSCMYDHVCIIGYHWGKMFKKDQTYPDSSFDRLADLAASLALCFVNACLSAFLGILPLLGKKKKTFQSLLLHSGRRIDVQVVQLS